MVERMRNGAEVNFTSGEKVTLSPGNKIYDFGYMSKTGKAVIYNPSERNMQDSIAVDVGLLKKL